MSRVLFVTGEMFPMASTGGLGDVSAALPSALRELGVDARVMMPAYPSALERLAKKGRRVALGTPGGIAEAAVVPGHAPDTGVPVYLVDCPALYNRAGGPYADAQGVQWPDNALRFALLCHAAAIVAGINNPLSWRADIAHANDWQAGLLPAIMATRREGRAPTVFSIHNLAFAGSFPYSVFGRLGLPAHTFSMHGVEFYGYVSFLKAGVYYADRLTTVSPTYAREIQTPAFGSGLDGLLRGRAAEVAGILNGVDYARWDPAHDPYTAAAYTPESLDGKGLCKAALQRELSLDVSPSSFLIGSVTRLTSQKGSDLMLQALPELLRRGVQLALLGAGDSALQKGFLDLAARHPGSVGVKIGYDDPLAHRIEAGADAFAMPSRFEPCGLNQMYSLKYGTPPIVHAVGGLADTIEDGVNGFSFGAPAAAALAAAMRRARDAFANKPAWREMQRYGMAQDFSWNRSAREYERLYASLLPQRRVR